MKPKIYIIGAGGVGSWLLPALMKLVKTADFCVIDGDKLEEKNLDRQLYSPDDIGRNKAEALAMRYGCDARPEWFAENVMEFNELDWLIVCVDNHTARRAALSEADNYGTYCLIAANETHSAEALFYHRRFRGTPVDPRVYYPDILTDKEGDPRAAAIGCTGEAQVQNPQLVTSNMMAAAMAGHLFALWSMAGGDAEEVYKWPYRFACTITRMESNRISDAMDKAKPNNERTDNA